MAGSEVVQLYVTLPYNGTTTPRFQLKGFAKARDIAPGKHKVVSMKLDKYSVSYWDEPNECWEAVAGRYGVHVGTSSENLSLEGHFELKNGFTWNGI